MGHLFQDRFRSENIDNNQYYMVVLRYILQNPMKAGLESCPGTFRWSSYLAYEKGAGAITDTEYALNLFGSRDALIEFVRRGNDDTVMDDSNCDKRIRDDVAESVMRQITGCVSVPEFQRLDRPNQKEYVKKMYHENLSSRQISRLTGLSKTTVIRIVNDTKVFSSESNDSLPLHESSETAFYNSEEIW